MEQIRDDTDENLPLNLGIQHHQLVNDFNDPPGPINVGANYLEANSIEDRLTTIQDTPNLNPSLHDTVLINPNNLTAQQQEAALSKVRVLSVQIILTHFI